MKIFGWAVLIWMIMVPHAVLAKATGTDLDLAKCAAVADSIARLACYDGLASAHGVAGPASESHSAGSWTVTTDTSPIDDTRTVVMSVTSVEDVITKYRNNGKATLLLRCRENRTALYVMWAGVFVGGETHTVTYRIDHAPAKKVRFIVATSNDASGLWDGATSLPLIRGLFGKSQLLLRMVPYAESEVTVSFDIQGVREQIRPLAAACGWKP